MEPEHRQSTRRLSNRRLANYYNQLNGLNQNVLGYEVNRKQLSNGQNSLVASSGYDGLSSLDYAEIDLGQGTQTNQANVGLGGQSLSLNQVAYGQNLGYNQGQLGMNNGYKQGLNMYNQGINSNAYNQYGLYDQNIGYSNYAGYGYNPYGGVDRLGYDDYDYTYQPSASYAYAGGFGGQPGGCSVGGVSPLLGLLVIAGAGVGFYFLWEKVQSIGGRKQQVSFLEFLDYVYNGKF